MQLSDRIALLAQVPLFNQLTSSELEAVAELSASLAHEIKNPLASIRSAVEQLSGAELTGEDRQVLAAGFFDQVV